MAGSPHKTTITTSQTKTVTITADQALVSLATLEAETIAAITTVETTTVETDVETTVAGFVNQPSVVAVGEPVAPILQMATGETTVIAKVAMMVDQALVSLATLEAEIIAATTTVETDVETTVAGFVNQPSVVAVGEAVVQTILPLDVEIVVAMVAQVLDSPETLADPTTHLLDAEMVAIAEVETAKSAS